MDFVFYCSFHSKSINKTSYRIFYKIVIIVFYADDLNIIPFNLEITSCTSEDSYKMSFSQKTYNQCVHSRPTYWT